MPAHVLVAYDSTHGHTARIAERLATVLRDAGCEAAVWQLGAGTAPVDPGDFDGVMVGASVHAGHHQASVARWLSEHHTTLAGRPSAFFSVSLTAAEDSAEARATTRALIDELLDETGWAPTATTAFAGALLFHEYNVPTRVLMRLIARRVHKRTGIEVDVHEDTDYTDWDAVERFGRDFAATVQRAMAPELPSAR